MVAGSPMERRTRRWFMDERRSKMAWFRVHLSEEEQRIVGEERREHPHEPTRRKMETLVAAAPWAYPRKGGEDCRRRLGDGETIRKRISGRRPRWSAALGEKGPNRFAGGPSRIARRIVSGTTSFKRGGGGRPHRAIDRDPSWPVTNAVVFAEARIALAADGCHSRPPKKVSRNMWQSSSGFSLTN